MEIKVIKNVDIDELDFSVRTWNCLRRARIDTVQDIAGNYHNLDRVRNLGKRCVDEINEKIRPYVEFVDRVRITNYDRIKAMSVEEMAEFLVKCDGDMQGTTKKEKQDEARDVQQWLLQEVSDNTNCGRQIQESILAVTEKGEIHNG